jgi:hypothetical protein
MDMRHGAMPVRDPITLAYFKGLEAPMTTERDNESPALPPCDHGATEPEAPAEAVAAIVDLLHEAGVISRAPRALLEGPQASAPRFARVRDLLQFAHDRDPHAYAMRSAELAYLANVIVAGSTIQSRPVAEEEASSAAVAVCNLGLENWPVHWMASGVRLSPSMTETGTGPPEDFLIRNDLVSVFQVGWSVLYEEVCMYAADGLVSVLASVRCADGDDQDALQALRVTLMKHWRAGSPWESRDALDVIAILDTPSWAALLGLLDQFPTLHAAVGASLDGTTLQVDPAAFEFISENAQIQKIHDFMESLPARLNAR